MDKDMIQILVEGFNYLDCVLAGNVIARLAVWLLAWQEQRQHIC
jgi:hypothetical protein